MSILALLFGLRIRVTRGPYLAWGLGLAVLKFGLDTAIVYGVTSKTWSPLGYLIPSIVLRGNSNGIGFPLLYALLPLAALPFLWVGLSMSVRRAADAGVSPWLGILFAVPLLNYPVIAVLCAMPSKQEERWNWNSLPPRPSGDSLPAGARTLALAIFSSMALGVVMLALCIYGLGTYGYALFFATPLAMGALSAALYNRGSTRPLGATLGVSSAAIGLVGLVCLLFAIEGVLCLAMAAPIAMAIAALGALIGRAVMAATRQTVLPARALMVMLPGIAVGEAHLAVPPLQDVVTSVEIDAPPERVWPNVIGFSELDEPPQWFFRLGIAYPKRAEISGEGVGAVRHCEFSTGAFVEPIKLWDPPHRLAFDVASQPPSLTEWSPYGAIHAPHLEGYMVSRGGEFDLVRLPGDRTRLEGTTHYTLAIYPELYWRPFAEVLLHAIHLRVLNHIKHLSEGPPLGFTPGPASSGERLFNSGPKDSRDLHSHPG